MPGKPADDHSGVPQQHGPSSPVYQNPELVRLFHTYTGGPTGIGANLKNIHTISKSNDPLLVATGTDIVLFPGDGRDPSFIGFRVSTKGFKELAAVSHLGTAMAAVVQMHQIDPSSTLWREDAQRLMEATVEARAANSASLWKDKIAVEAYLGRETQIAAMLDYGCALTIRLLQTVMADETKLNSVFLRQAYLEGTDGSLGATIPFNFVMIATFFLVGLDFTYRITKWLLEEKLNWSRTMVLMIGKIGRPTSGVTWTSNSIVQMILGASSFTLPLDRVYIAPHASSFTITNGNADELRKFEEPMRSLWSYTRAISELGPIMFEGYPPYKPDTKSVAPVITRWTSDLQEMPMISGPEDMYTMTTRMRLVLEDPRQLLSGCVTDYAVQQLADSGNDYSATVVPGLDGVEFPLGLDVEWEQRSAWSNRTREFENGKALHTIRPAQPQWASAAASV